MILPGHVFVYFPLYLNYIDIEENKIIYIYIPVIMDSIKLIVIIVVIVIIVLFIGLSKKEVVYVQSDIDNVKYLVRDLPDKDKAANMLARIKMNLKIVVDDLVSKKDTEYKEYKSYIEQLSSKFNSIVLNESSEDSVYTSYSVNKGEQIVFCLRSKTDKNTLHDVNLVMYVALHEISHVACPEYGHTMLFKKIFAFITSCAMRSGVYEYIKFSEQPTEYCGLTISESII
jgi:hypothetical protein